MNKKITLIDTTLRDGSHAIKHSFTNESVKRIAKGLDEANIKFIELSHGDGLGGSCYTYGFSKVDEFELLKSAASVIKNSMLTVLLLPGIATIEDLTHAKECGAKAARVATHVTEADVSAEHIKAARDMNLFTVGFLMMAHMSAPELIAEEAKKMESYGADYINIADSAGYMLPDDVASVVDAVLNAIDIPVGFHAHNNLGSAIANTIKAIETGAEYVDGSLRGMGAGAGNTQLEVLTAILKRKNLIDNIDFYKLMDIAQQEVEPILIRPQVIDNGSLMLGYTGVYSSFLHHVYNSAERFGLDSRDILTAVGERKLIGGQEDMITDIAYELSNKL